MNLLDLRIQCPACTSIFTLAEGIELEKIKEVANLVVLFGPDWPLVNSYLACFRTDTGRGIRLERMIIILTELAAIWRENKMVFRGQEVVLNPFVLRSAVREMGQRCDTLYGLKDHNYLKKVLESKMKLWHRERAAQEKESLARDARGERPREEEPGAPPPGEVREFIEKTGDKIGGKKKPSNHTQEMYGRLGQFPCAIIKVTKEDSQSFQKKCEEQAQKQGINLKGGKK